jgi:type IV pilus assembly protein PilB
MDVIEAAEDIDLEELERSAGEAPVEKLCNLILVEALRRGASEIHIEPYERSFNIRLRLDGVLYMIMNPPLRLRDAISNRFKVMAKMDIVEKRLPQRGRIRIRVNFGGKLSTHDFELHTLPTQWGEKLFLRLHDLAPKDLGELGLEESSPNRAGSRPRYRDGGQPGTSRSGGCRSGGCQATPNDRWFDGA